MIAFGAAALLLVGGTLGYTAARPPDEASAVLTGVGVFVAFLALAAGVAAAWFTYHTFGPPKTRAGHRSVPVPCVVAEALGAHLEDVPPGELLFTAPEGGPVRSSLWRRRSGRRPPYGRLWRP